jgi:integrase
MKAAREHRVPLSEAALAIAKKAIEQDPEFLFTGRSPRHRLSNMAMTMLCADSAMRV